MSLAAGDTANVTRLDCDVHVGTHLENSLHFLADGQPVDAIPFDVLVGPAFVAHVAGADNVGSEELGRSHIPAGTTRLLLRTRNSDRSWWGDAGFRADYAGLTEAGARWIVENGIKLVGIDYLSIAAYAEIEPTHHELMRNGVAILEGLDLSRADPGEYELLCLPLSLPGAEAAPARAVLRVL
jgi:arylformamidase